MAVLGAQVAVSTTAVALNPVETDVVSGGRLLVRNFGANEVAIGSAAVTAGTGFRLATGALVDIELSGGEQVFAISTLGTTVDVLRTGM